MVFASEMNRVDCSFGMLLDEFYGMFCLFSLFSVRNMSSFSIYICKISVNVQALLGEHVEKEDAKVGRMRDQCVGC